MMNLKKEYDIGKYIRALFVFGKSFVDSMSFA